MNYRMLKQNSRRAPDDTTVRQRTQLDRERRLMIEAAKTEEQRLASIIATTTTGIRDEINAARTDNHSPKGPTNE